MDSSATRVSPAKGGRAWELPGKGFSTLEGSGKEHLVEAAQDRLLENVVAGINQDTAQGKRIREQWTCAQASNLQVKEALRARNFPTQLPGLNASGHGRKATRDACEAFWPEKWCRVLDDDEILAELVVDCAINSIVDSFLDSAIELLDAHEGWALKSTGSGKSPHRSVGLGNPLVAGGWAAVSSSTFQPNSLELPSTQHPDVPTVYRHRTVCNSMTKSRSSGEIDSSTERDNGRSTLKHFRSPKPLDPFMERLHAFTESQRPARRLTRKQSDPFAPKWSLPMMASNFPEYWNTIAPPPKPQTIAVSTPGGGGGHRASLSEEWGEDEVVPPGYNWLQRKTRDGQTVFPYSLASHKAFFESYNDPTLRAKATEVAPLRMTEWD